MAKAGKPNTTPFDAAAMSEKARGKFRAINVLSDVLRQELEDAFGGIWRAVLDYDNMLIMIRPNNERRYSAPTRRGRLNI